MLNWTLVPRLGRGNSGRKLQLVSKGLGLTSGSYATEKVNWAGKEEFRIQGVAISTGRHPGHRGGSDALRRGGSRGWDGSSSGWRVIWSNPEYGELTSNGWQNWATREEV